VGNVLQPLSQNLRPARLKTQLYRYTICCTRIGVTGTEGGIARIFYFPTQNREKILPRMSSTVVAPVMVSRARTAAYKSNRSTS
jgi:hypothetical protein